jgi:hypothetical protein
MYTDKEIQEMIDFAETKLREGVTREEAIEMLAHVGILDADGNHTELFEKLLTEAGIQV